MELLFSTIIGAGIGSLFRYILPGRSAYGSLLVPAASAAVTAVVWVVLVWAGWKFDGGWIWVVSLVAGGVAGLVLALTLPRTRQQADGELLQRLSRASSVPN
jgi:hypothetical protein